jgi:hypothetical protein
MSYVSNVTLICSVMEDEPGQAIAEIKQWLAERCGERAAYWELKEVSDYAGGAKAMECLVYCGGFNYFDEDDFAEFVLSLEWDHPENVVLIIDPQEGQTRVFRPVRWAYIQKPEKQDEAA